MTILTVERDRIPETKTYAPVAAATAATPASSVQRTSTHPMPTSGKGIAAADPAGVPPTPLDWFACKLPHVWPSPASF